MLASFAYWLQANAAWGLTQESCSTGQYKDFYPNTCDQCGFYDGTRLYEGKQLDYWDYFNHNWTQERVFSSRSTVEVVDFWNYISWENSINSDIRSNWVPASLPENDAVVFVVDNLVGSNYQDISRNTPVWRVEYNIRWGYVSATGDIPLNSTEWRYLEWQETNNNGLWFLSAQNFVSDGGGTKNMDSSTIFDHQECFLLLPASCWDGVVDLEYGEKCDDGNTNDNDGCNSVCEVESDYDLALKKTLSNSTPGPFTIWDEVTFNITVYNQGDIDSGNIEITDYIPEGLSFDEDDNDNWDDNNDKATYQITNIEAGEQRTISITFTINNEASTIIRNFAEISEDDNNYTDCDSIPDDENRNQVGETVWSWLIDNSVGNWCNPWGDEDDHDVEEITIQNSEDIYDLALRKTLSSSTPGPFNIGDNVTFDIEIFNQGNVTASNIAVIDYVPEGLTLIEWWDFSLELDGTADLSDDIDNLEAWESRVVSINFTINNDAPRSITNYAEIWFDDGLDCDSTTDEDNTNDGTPINDDIWSGCDEGWDEDDHDPETIVVQDGEDIFDLALIKTLSDGQSSTFAIGSDVNFDISVTNQWNTLAFVQEIVDYIPTGLTLNDGDWDLENGNAYYNPDIILLPGQTETIQITFIVNDDASETIRNFAEISETSGWDDCDSTPDDTNWNQDGETEISGMEDNETGGRCDDDEDEDDHDFEDITIGTPAPSVKIDKTDANPDLDQDGNIGGNDSQRVNVWQEAVFKIRVTNDGTEALEEIVISDIQAPNCAGDVTLPGTYPSSWSNFTTGWSGNLTNSVLEPGEYFEYTCSKSDTQADYTNTARVDAEWIDSAQEVSDSDTSRVDVPGGGWSGDTYRCNDIVSWTASNDVPVGQVRCYGSRKVEAFYIENCSVDVDGNSIDSSVSWFSLDSNGRRYADFTCSNTNIECKVYDDDVTNIGTWRAWRGWNQCKLDVAPSCGNWVVEAGEQCDISAAPYGDWGDCGKPGTSRECKLPGGGGWDPSCEDDESCVLTWPNDGELIFGPHGSKVVGHWVNPVEEFGEKPYLWNNSDYDFSFEQLCIKRDSDNSITGWNTLANSTYCKDLTSRNRMIYAYEKVEFDDYPSFTTDKDGIPSGAAYGEGTFSTTIYDDWLLYENAYFAGKLEVRVAKPAVVTTGWGTSYVKDSSVTGDLRKVTDGLGGDYIAEQDTNTNFAWVSASESADAVSSNALELDNSDSEAILDVQESQESLDEVQEVIDTAGAISGSFTNYNGFDNVFIVSWDYTLSSSDISDIASLSEPTTYIVENGDLTIPANISANKNVAFVANWWDIIIDGSVTEIDGTYISIKTVSWGGSIRSNGGTNSQIVVNGPLYGDISDLVDNRYYVDDTAGKLSVGTIVSFGSSLLTKPAPLVSQFVAEYLASEKVAR